MTDAGTPLEWTPLLSVGHEDLDAQHRELFRRAGEVILGVRAGRGVELAGLIEFLHEYAVGHFAFEEERMRESAFPGYLRHCAEHARFLEDLLEVADEHERNGRDTRLGAKLSDWLSEWMRRHVEGIDSELGRHLARCGAAVRDGPPTPDDADRSDRRTAKGETW